MDSRERILADIRAAVAGRPTPEVPRDYRSADPGVDAVALFVERASDYRAEVRRVTDPAAAVAEVCAGLRVAVPPELPAAWAPDGAATDGGLSTAKLDGIDAALTGCAVAIAETGTLILDGGGRSGRRALTLVPDMHVCVVEAAQVVATVPEALARVDPRRALTLVSGPSATSDIELDRVEGVHGPRRLVILVVG